MFEYHKIKTVYKRDPDNNYKTLLEGDFAVPEFDYLKDDEWVFTEKIDGTNIRVIWDSQDNSIIIKGKTDKAQIPKFLLDNIEPLFTKSKLKELFPDTDICLYGEGFGARIQKGGGNYIPNGTGFILFDVKIGNWWLKREDIEAIAGQLNIMIVPIVGRGILRVMVNMVKDGFPSAIGNCIAEGVVARPRYELFDRAGRRIITKLKYKDFERKS